MPSFLPAKRSRESGSLRCDLLLRNAEGLQDALLHTCEGMIKLIPTVIDLYELNFLEFPDRLRNRHAVPLVRQLDLLILQKVIDALTNNERYEFNENLCTNDFR